MRAHQIVYKSKGEVRIGHILWHVGLTIISSGLARSYGRRGKTEFTVTNIPIVLCQLGSAVEGWMLTCTTGDSCRRVCYVLFSVIKHGKICCEVRSLSSSKIDESDVDIFFF